MVNKITSADLITEVISKENEEFQKTVRLAKEMREDWEESVSMPKQCNIIIDSRKESYSFRFSNHDCYKLAIGRCTMKNLHKKNI